MNNRFEGEIFATRYQAEKALKEAGYNRTEYVIARTWYGYEIMSIDKYRVHANQR